MDWFLNDRDHRRERVNLVTIKRMKQLLQSLNAEKAVGIDSNHVIGKTSSYFYFYKSLIEAISFCIQHSNFSNSASVVPLDKGKPSKNEILNFGPVSVLNTFSKICELTIKNKMVIATEKYLSPLVLP